jgi:hypothetical protein
LCFLWRWGCEGNEEEDELEELEGASSSDDIGTHWTGTGSVAVVVVVVVVVAIEVAIEAVAELSEAAVTAGMVLGPTELSLPSSTCPAPTSPALVVEGVGVVVVAVVQVATSADPEGSGSV